MRKDKKNAVTKVKAQGAESKENNIKVNSTHRGFSEQAGGPGIRLAGSRVQGPGKKGKRGERILCTNSMPSITLDT